MVLAAGRRAAVPRRHELADLALRPDMHPIGMLDWQQFDRAIEIGYRGTRETLRDEAPSTQQETQ